VLINDDYENVLQGTILDTEREKEISLGTEWPYEPLKAGECIVSSKFEEADVGQTVQVSIDAGSLTEAMTRYFREEVWSGSYRSRIRVEKFPLEFPCKVTAKISESYGKFGNNFHKEVFIMEYN